MKSGCISPSLLLAPCEFGLLCYNGLIQVLPFLTSYNQKRSAVFSPGGAHCGHGRAEAAWHFQCLAAGGVGGLWALLFVRKVRNEKPSRRLISLLPFLRILIIFDVQRLDPSLDSSGTLKSPPTCSVFWQLERLVIVSWLE